MEEEGRTWLVPEEDPLRELEAEPVLVGVEEEEDLEVREYSKHHHLSPRKRLPPETSAEADQEEGYLVVLKKLVILACL